MRYCTPIIFLISIIFTENGLGCIDDGFDPVFQPPLTTTIEPLSTTVTPKDEQPAVSMKKAFSYDTIQLPEVAWQDFFHRCHSTGKQHFLVCSLTRESSDIYYDMYLKAITRLLIGNSDCRLTVVKREERRAELAPVTEDMHLKCDCKSVAVDCLSNCDSRRKFYTDIRANKLINNHRILSYLHFIPITDNVDFPEEIPSYGMNAEKFSAIFLSLPLKDYATPFSWLNHRGILYIPYREGFGTNATIEALVKAGFKRRYIVITAGLICASKIDPNDFQPARIRAAEKDLLTGPLTPTMRKKGWGDAWEGTCNIL